VESSRKSARFASVPWVSVVLFCSSHRAIYACHWSARNTVVALALYFAARIRPKLNHVHR